MTIRAITLEGDWTFGKGLQDYADLDQAIKFGIATRLRLYQGEAFWDTQAGVPWFSLLGQKNVDPIVYEIRKAILAVDGVVAVHDVSVSLDSQRRALLQYSIDTIYTQGIQGSVLV